jgi:hypothetical protein
MALAKFHRQCSKNIAGNMNLFLAEAANVYSVTVTAGEVSDIVMLGASEFLEIQCDQNTFKRLTSGARANKSFTFYSHSIEFQVSKASKEAKVLSDALDDGQPCGFIAIAMDSNGQAWLIGWSEAEGDARPLYLETSEFDSGDNPTAGGNNIKFKLTGENDENDLPCNATINTYISGSIAAGSDLGFTP